MWAEKGSWPRTPKDFRYEWAYLFGAVCAERGVGALVLAYANADAMTLHLAEVSRQVTAGAHELLVCDGAGWYQTGGRLQVPSNITLLHLPPYAPELNPVENIWQYLRGNTLSMTVWETYTAIVDACYNAWNGLMKDTKRIVSIITRNWAQFKA